MPVLGLRELWLEKMKMIADFEGNFNSMFAEPNALKLNLIEMESFIQRTKAL
jgi:hypothetical protein